MIGLFCRIPSLLQGSFAKEMHMYAVVPIVQLCRRLRNESATVSQIAQRTQSHQCIFRNNCNSYCGSCTITVTVTPPKNGLIALLLTTNGLMCSKFVSQKRNEAIDNCQAYKMLLNFILSIAMTLYQTKIHVPSNLSQARLTTWQQ